METRRYKQGISRRQGMLLPPRIEEYITEDNPVRAIDVYLGLFGGELVGIDGSYFRANVVKGASTPRNGYRKRLRNWKSRSKAILKRWTRRMQKRLVKRETTSRWKRN